MIKKILLVLLAQLIAWPAFAQTFKVGNLNVTGTSTFAVRPTFNGNTPYDTGNLSLGSYAPLASPVFTGSPVVPGYLTTATAASTYAPIAAPTFTGIGTIPSGWSIGGYLTSATAASTYLPIANPTATGTVTATTFSGAGTSLTGTASSLSIGGNATTATRATNVAGGVVNQIPVQSAANTTTFLASPTVSSTCLQWNGTSITWATCGSGGGGSGTVTSVAMSGGSTGLTFTGGPITSSGTFTAGGLLGVGYGGTGDTTLTQYGVLLGNGTGAIAATAAGTAGYNLVGQGSANPQWQQTQLVLTGADPTGATDSTTAIQNFINTVVVNGYHGLIPPGTYKISAAISMPFGVGYLIEGNARGATIINQTAANTPIFNWASGSGGVGGHSFAVDDIYFQWSTAPTISQTHSIALAFNNSADSWFDFQFNRITCNNGYECIGIDAASNGTIWGASIRDLVVGGTVCSAFDDNAGGTGQPSIEIDGAYLTASSMAASCPLINANNNDSGWFNHIEVNAVPNGNTILEATGEFAVGTIKVEDATYGSGQFIYQFPNAHATINALDMEDLTIAATGGAAYGIDINGGGATSTVTVGQVNLTFATGISGNFYLVNGGAAPTYSLILMSNPAGLLGTTGAYLTQVPAAVSADGVSVLDWQQPRLTADAANTSVTYTAGGPNIVLYNSAITASRTVTLGDSSTNTNDTNLYNGLKVCVLRTTAATGAFTILVKNSAGTTIGTFPASTYGEMCWMWKRSVGAWVQTDQQVLNGTL